jgi:hypothetical protein
MAIFKANCKASKPVWENSMDMGHFPKEEYGENEKLEL